MRRPSRRRMLRYFERWKTRAKDLALDPADTQHASQRHIEPDYQDVKQPRRLARYVRYAVHSVRAQVLVQLQRCRRVLKIGLGGLQKNSDIHMRRSDYMRRSQIVTLRSAAVASLMATMAVKVKTQTIEIIHWPSRGRRHRRERCCCPPLRRSLSSGSDATAHCATCA